MGEELTEGTSNLLFRKLVCMLCALYYYYLNCPYVFYFTIYMCETDIIYIICVINTVYYT